MAVGNTPLYLPAGHGIDSTILDTYQQQFQLLTVAALPSQGLYLQFDEAQRLSLYQAGSKGAVCVDFVSGRLDYRRQKGGGELIAKAINTKQHQHVVDATAGLGRDAFILAAQGCTVHLFERHPTVATLLQDGLRRALADEATHDIAQRMCLTPMSFLQAAIDTVQVVYLDPMYPQRQKSAAVKKEMAYFHELVGSNDDDLALLQQAAQHAEKRVVVKRPRLGDFLGNFTPDYQYSGKSTRFDVYLPAKLQAALA